MSHRSLRAVLLGIVGLFASACASSTSTSSSSATPLAELLQHPRDFADATVRTQGTVCQTVCRGMGCWMNVGAGSCDGGPIAAVTLEGSPFGLPQGVAGRTVDIVGRVAAPGSTDFVRISATSLELR